jgi:23S rRNA (cytidine1920-2'-O)/16S rRNA (cytidine1409-2'-O)-methyltransferase
MAAALTRLDLLLVERGLVKSCEEARASVMAGLVLLDGRPAAKPGQRAARDAAVEVRGRPHPYVSRGGLKLEFALDRFGVAPRDLVALDVGAATGGFTDCLLRRGARLVYALDVGYGQLAWTLRNDPRVVCLERVNVRYLNPARLAPRPDLATIDISFISVGKAFPAVAAAVGPGGRVLALVKPQFEVGPRQVGKRGVVRDAALHRATLEGAAADAARAGLAPLGATYSPILGPAGNMEFWLLLAVPAARVPPGGPATPGAGATAIAAPVAAAIAGAVAEAHQALATK